MRWLWFLSRILSDQCPVLWGFVVIVVMIVVSLVGWVSVLFIYLFVCLKDSHDLKCSLVVEHLPRITQWGVGSVTKCCLQHAYNKPDVRSHACVAHWPATSGTPSLSKETVSKSRWEEQLRLTSHYHACANMCVCICIHTQSLKLKRKKGANKGQGSVYCASLGTWVWSLEAV